MTEEWRAYASQQDSVPDFRFGSKADIHRLTRAPRRPVAKRVRVFKARLADLGGRAFASSPTEFGEFIAGEIEKFGKVIKFADVKPE